jgi:hypothetical protein
VEILLYVAVLASKSQGKSRALDYPDRHVLGAMLLIIPVPVEPETFPKLNPFWLYLFGKIIFFLHPLTLHIFYLSQKHIGHRRS